MRVRVTDLEQYRRFRMDEDMPYEPLRRQLLRLDPPNRKMLAGTAWHKVLETSGDALEVETVECDGFRFRVDLDAAVVVPAFRELAATKTYDVGGRPVTLSGKVDATDGTIVYDHKLTSRFDAEVYADSYQWRAYLTMFEAKAFVYNVFEGEEDEKAGEWVIYAYHRLAFFPYRSMRLDVLREMRMFTEFVEKNLPEYGAVGVGVPVSPAVPLSA